MVDAECVERALDRKQFDRAWRTTLGAVDRDAIRAALIAGDVASDDQTNDDEEHTR